ncbi:hypothetical protein [Acidovorax sp. Root70]|uniref:hypothetical protein n=1 Tax=Acidovorax sp. Root70 TaxID=1736590 RepID=UPI0012E3EC62|nr:hypothetical protein [Acidovorax sp. Root70]
MFTYIAVVVGVVWLLTMVLVWNRMGLGKGRRFGNKIAKHLGMDKNFFHTVIDSGVSGPSLQVLAMLEGAGCSLERASIELAPSLERGLIALEARFGRQEMIESAKPVVVRLLKEWAELQEQRGQQ